MVNLAQYAVGVRGDKEVDGGFFLIGSESGLVCKWEVNLFQCVRGLRGDEKGKEGSF